MEITLRYQRRLSGGFHGKFLEHKKTIPISDEADISKLCKILFVDKIAEYEYDSYYPSGGHIISKWKGKGALEDGKIYSILNFIDGPEAGLRRLDQIEEIK